MDSSILCPSCGRANSVRSLRCVGCKVELPPASVPEPEQSLVGRKIGNYEIVDAIAGGPRASIYRARHAELKRGVALKVLGRELSADDKAKARFAREGRALARVAHPNVVVVHEVGEVDGRPFLAMALHEGTTLRARLEAGPLVFEHAAGVAHALAGALAAIHEQGIVHRDLKPENVVFPKEGGMVLVDFGLARLDEREDGEEHTITAPGAVIGTLPYLAPEQLLGERADSRADIWALGVIAFEMLTGTPPFAKDAAVASIIEGTPRRVRGVKPSVPAPLANMVDSLLATSKSERASNAQKVAREIFAAFPSLTPPEEQRAIEPLDRGEVLGERLRLAEEIGRGDSGSVWRAEHLVLGVPCAVKFLHAEIASQPKIRAKFLEEGRTLAKLRSPHIVQVLDAGTHKGRPYLAMELLEGRTLEEELEATAPLGTSRAMTLLGQLADGLDAAHQGGVVHRDLKPSNVFLSTERGKELVKLIDFGISKSVGETVGSTHRGTSAESTAYMSPEQIEAKGHVDHRTDLWSLGITAARVLTGKVPFEGTNVMEVCEAIVAGEVPSLSAGSNLPPTFDDWLRTALARPPEERFSSAKEMIERLDALVGGGDVSLSGKAEAEAPTVPLGATSPLRSTRVRKKKARVTLTAIVTVAVLVALAGLLGAWLGSWVLSAE